MLEAKLEYEIQGLGKIYRVYAQLDKALESLEKNDAQIITARDLAYARIALGIENLESTLSKHGIYIMEGTIFVPGYSTLVVSKSPIMEFPNKEIAAAKNNEPFYIDAQKYIEIVEEDRYKEPQERRVLDLGREQYKFIPTNRFAEEEITLFMFKDMAREYGEFLESVYPYEMRLPNGNLPDKMPVEKCVLSFPADYVDKRKMSFARPAWISSVTFMPILNLVEGRIGAEEVTLYGVSRITK